MQREMSGIRRLSRWRGWTAVLLVLWVLALLPIPLIQRQWGEHVFYAAVSASVALQAGVVWLLLARAIGIRKTVRITVIVLVLAWLSEAVGTHTGVPFGRYAYTSRRVPQFGRVPLLIPLAWLMLLPPAWAVAGLLVGRAGGWRFVLVSALAFTAWDLFLDPQMVGWGLWVWERPSGYFGIPWVNFLGWVAVSTVITLAAHPPARLGRPLLGVYTLTWIMQTVGLGLFWGQPGPALAGAVGMGFFALAAWRQVRRTG